MASHLSIAVIVSGAILTALRAQVVSPQASAPQAAYDLGGPCHNQPPLNDWRQIKDAEESGDWDRVVALEKQAVRAACDNESAWWSLGNALVRAGRPAEASRLLWEMDARRFDVNSEFVKAYFPEIVKFMDSREFMASPLGLKIRQLKKISDERRIKFQGILSRMPASDRPPEHYVAKGACPFECCRYGNWTVLEDTELVSSPGSRDVIARAAKGSSVAGITGEVHLRPDPVVVIGGGDLPSNSIAFILDYVGEGYGNVYARGKVVQTFLGYAHYCLRPSESCWGEMLWPANGKRKQIWWVKVRLANGVAGWTNKTDNFGGKDACA